MKRSQSLPIGLFMAGVCFACICTLALMTAWYNTHGRLESIRSNPDSTVTGAFLLDAPAHFPEPAETSGNSPVLLADYVQQDVSSPLKSVDLIKAAQNLSGNVKFYGHAGTDGLIDNTSVGPASEFHEQPIGDSLGNAGCSFQNKRQSTATTEEVEADRLWLLSLDMNGTPDRPLDCNATFQPSSQIAAASELEQELGQRNPALESAIPISWVDGQYEIDESRSEPENMAPPGQESKPSLLLSRSTVQNTSKGNAIGPNEPHGALSDKEAPTHTGIESPLSSDLELISMVTKPADFDIGFDESGSSTGERFKTKTAKSLTSEIDVRTDHLKTTYSPAVGSIGDQLSDNEVYSLGDQPVSPSPFYSPAAGSMLATHERSQFEGWPLPTSLIQELKEWKTETLTSQWATAVESTILQLNNTRIDDPESLAHIQYCEQLAYQLVQHARVLPRGQELLASRMNRLSMRMKRRFSVWTAVHRVSLTHVTQVDSHSKTLAQTVNQRRIEFDHSDVPAEWIDYLMLDKAAEVFESSKATELHRQTTARKILARVSSPALSDDQLLFARQLIGNELGSLLRDAASGEIDPGKFLNDLESFEEGDSPIAEALINNHFQAFYWSRDSQVQELAAVFDENYRNANFQIEISDRLINNVLPRNITVHQPVQDRILGAQVFGNSRVQNQVSVELIPDADRLSFRLNSSGSVLSRTMAHSSGFVFNNLGNALINASKGISIGPEGIYTMPTDVEADAHSKLLNVRSRVDSVPLVGWMARQVAEQKQYEQSHKANLIVEQKLRNEFGSRVDEEIQTSVDQGRNWVKQRIVDPFNAMELEPMIANMHTTDRTAVIRYRLAGLDQNASNTIQPRSLPGCLVGVQIHESAVNNIINRIGINGETFSAPQFMQHISALLGRPDIEMRAGEYEDVKFQFASRDSVRLDFDEDRVAITLRLKRLQIGRTGLWKNLTVTAWYIPRASGLHIDMALDPEKAVSLTGQDLSVGDQLATRTVFNAVFKPNFDFPLLSPELASRPAARGIGVSQIVLVDGWVGLSVSEYGPNYQSQLRQPPMLRNARILQNRLR